MPSRRLSAVLSSALGPVLWPGLRVARNIPFALKWVLLVGVPFAVVFLLLTHSVTESLEAQRGAAVQHAAVTQLRNVIDLQALVEEHQALSLSPRAWPGAEAATWQRRMHLAAAQLTAALAAAPAWGTSPLWHAAKACTDKLPLLAGHPAADVVAAHDLCLDQLERFAAVTAERSGLARSADPQAFALQNLLLNDAMPLNRARLHASTLLGQPSSAAYLLRPDLRSWVGPEGWIERQLRKTDTKAAEAARHGLPVPPGFDAVRQHLHTLAGQLDAKLELGDLVAAAALPDHLQLIADTRQAVGRWDTGLCDALQARTLALFEQANRALWLTSAGALAVLLSGLYAAASVAMAFALQLRSVRSCLAGLTQGLLASRAEVQGSDELAQLARDANHMAEQLQELVGHVVRGSVRIAQGGENLSVSAQSLATRSTEQGRNLASSAAALGQLADSVGATAALSTEVDNMSAALADRARRSGALIGQTVALMHDIQGRAATMRAVLGEIDRIAAQTHLLSLNAAIEAARAGSSGRGFALVASEVRNLAEHSRRAAADIQRMIRRSDEGIAHGVQQITGVRDDSAALVQLCQQQAGRLREVAARNVEQKGALDLMRQSLEEIANLTQQNASMVHSSAQAAEAVWGEALQLQGNVARLQGAEEGAAWWRRLATESAGRLLIRASGVSDDVHFKDGETERSQRRETDWRAPTQEKARCER